MNTMKKYGNQAYGYAKKNPWVPVLIFLAAAGLIVGLVFLVRHLRKEDEE